MIHRLPVRHVTSGLHHLFTLSDLAIGGQITQEEGNTFSPSRTISIRNLPKGYPNDVGSILAPLKLNPVETISPSYYGRGILVNCLSAKRAEWCIANYHDSALNVRLVRTDRSLAAYLVAAIGYTGLSRSCRIEHIPQGVPERQVKAVMCPQRRGNRQDFESWHFDQKASRLDVRFMCLSQAMNAKENIYRSPILKGTKMTYCDAEEPDYGFPEWYTPEEEHQEKVKRAVFITNLTGSEKSLPCREWANDWQGVSPTLLFCGLHPAKDMMHLEFATSTAAQQFVKQFQSKADELDVGLEIQETHYAVTRSLITALSLGASRTLVLTVNGTKSIPEISEIFKQQGNLTQLTRRQRENDTVFFITFENVSMAMRTVIRMGRILNEGFPGLTGAIVGFLDAPYLKPIIIRDKARAKFNGGPV
ncbi:hypothetical protein DFS33DRAFT_1383352 [Desarmillaria ectypa]|nr:hypothetical protein DFS33DRAFT_1383352 [Desarmillaria ectypa]